MVSTEINKPAKLARPTLTLAGNEVTWDAIAGAGGYDLYIDGVLKKANLFHRQKTCQRFIFLVI